MTIYNALANSCLIIYTVILYSWNDVRMKNETNCGFTLPNFLLLLSLSFCAVLVLSKFLENEGGFVSFVSCALLFIRSSFRTRSAIQ